MKLTKEQIKNLLIFLNRANLQGNEADILVQLKMLLVKELEKKPEEKPEEVKPK